MNQATLTITYRNTAGTTTVSSEVVEGDQEINIEREQLAAGSVDIEFDVTVPVAKILAMALGCKRSAAVGGVANEGSVEVTVQTNNGTTPDDTFVITPQNGYGWSPGSIDPILVTEDITKLYVSITGTAKADISFRFLVDSTPGLAN